MAKAKETTDFRNLTKDELNLKVESLKTDLYNLRYQATAGRIEKPHRIKQIRKTIARINTILNEGNEGALKNEGRPKQT